MRKCLVPTMPSELKHGASMHQAREVTDLDAELDADGEAVVLYLTDPNRVETPLAYVLSPPAAAQLSDLLADAVQKYLYCSRKDGQTQEGQD